MSHYDDLLCFNLYVGWRRIQAYYAPCFPETMNPQRIYVLGLCAEAPCTVSHIADVLCLGLPPVSGLLSRMERDGLLQRRRSPKSRREVIVEITDAGRRAMHEADRCLRRADSKLFEHVDERDVVALRRVVRAIAKAGAEGTQ